MTDDRDQDGRELFPADAADQYAQAIKAQFADDTMAVPTWSTVATAYRAGQANPDLASLVGTGSAKWPGMIDARDQAAQDVAMADPAFIVRELHRAGRPLP
jgi:hypothetical protein